MKRYILALFLPVILLLPAFAVDLEVKLTESQSDNLLISLPVSYRIEEEKLYVDIGSGRRLTDIYGRQISLWIFNEHTFYQSFEKNNNRVYSTTGFYDEVGRDGFISLKLENIEVDSKLKHIQIDNSKELVFTILDPSATASVEFYFYASDNVKQKKKDIRFFSAFNPYKLVIEPKKKRTSAVIAPGIYTSEEQKDSITFITFGRNLVLALSEAEALLTNAKADMEAGEDISSYLDEMEAMNDELDIAWYEENFRSQIKDNNEVRQDIKRFGAIQKELAKLQNKSLANQASAAEEEAQKDKKDPIWYIILGVGGMLISGLVIMLINGIIQSIRNKSREKKEQKKQKKQLEEQERMIKESQKAAEPKVRKKI